MTDASAECIKTSEAEQHISEEMIERLENDFYSDIEEMDGDIHGMFCIAQVEFTQCMLLFFLLL